MSFRSQEMKKLVKKIGEVNLALGVKESLKKSIPDSRVVMGRAKRGLYAGRQIQFGNQISEDGGNKQQVMNQFSSEGLWWAQSSESNTSSKYKGVVPQPNGRWGAQIYENNHRLWLGTFDSQEAAAMSYDRAASMFRGSDATLNFLHQPHHVVSSHEMEVEEEETVEEEEDEREHMFEKPLTPSDVGKLNRLVIPKQYAEKYFPIGGSDSVDKGLLLSFEDEAGKVWKFRYSYWNSSQSYVLTKGWSRFVKDKQLDAGDVVWFERKMINNQHMLIRWRRRVPPPSAQDNLVVVTTSSPTNLQSQSNSNSAAAWTHGYYPAEAYPSHHYHHLHGSLLYQPDCLHAAVEPPVIQNPTTVTGNSKRLRLFGVNLDCQLDEPAGPEDGSYDFLSSNQAQAHYFTNASSYNNYKESNFSRDQTEDDRGRDLSM